MEQETTESCKIPFSVDPDGMINLVYNLWKEGRWDVATDLAETCGWELDTKTGAIGLRQFKFQRFISKL